MPFNRPEKSERTVESASGMPSCDSKPITGVLIGEYHDAIAAPLLLRYLNPTIVKYGFNCHLVEAYDDIDQTELVRRHTSTTEKLTTFVEMIKNTLYKLKDENPTALGMFYENLTLSSTSRIRYIIEFLQDNDQHEFDSISNNITYRIPHIPNRVEQVKLFNELIQLNFTLAGIDPSDARGKLEDCIGLTTSSEPPRCYEALIRATKTIRNEKMAQHLFDMQKSGTKCTMIVGAAHLMADGMLKVFKKEDFDNFLILQPSKHLLHGGWERIEKRTCYDPDYNHLYTQNINLYTYSINNANDAELVATKIKEIIDDSYCHKIPASHNMTIINTTSCTALNHDECFAQDNIPAAEFIGYQPSLMAHLARLMSGAINVTAVGVVSGFSDSISKNPALKHISPTLINKLLVFATMYALDYSFANMFVLTGFQFILQEMGLSKNKAVYVSWGLLMALSMMSDDTGLDDGETLTNKALLFVADSLVAMLGQMIGYYSGEVLGGQVNRFSNFFFNSKRSVEPNMIEATQENAHHN